MHTVTPRHDQNISLLGGLAIDTDEQVTDSSKILQRK